MTTIREMPDPIIASEGRRQGARLEYAQLLSEAVLGAIDILAISLQLSMGGVGFFCAQIHLPLAKGD